jgi:iron complex transport system substrate-binding protein
MISLNGLRWTICLVILTFAIPAPVNAEYQRIVSLSPHITELLYSINAEHKLVATVKHSDYPDAAKNLPRIGDVFRLDWEHMLNMKPDLVIGWQDGTPVHVLERIEALGMRLELVRAAKLDSIATQLRQLGELTGKSIEAERIATKFLQKLHSLKNKYSGRRAVSVFYEVDHAPLYTINGQQIISDAIRLCGGRNVFEELDVLAPQVSIESVIQRGPEVIFYAGSEDQAEKVFKDWRRWPQMEAVRKNHLHIVDPDLMNRPTPRMLQGIQQLCDALDAAR